MRERRPALKEHLGKVPRNFPFWYLAFILLLVWLWQAAVGQYAVRTIEYSEFKKALKNGEVTECVVKPDAIDGKIQPRSTAATTPMPAPLLRPRRSKIAAHPVRQKPIYSIRLGLTIPTSCKTWKLRV